MTDQKKRRLPRHNIKVGDQLRDGFELGAYRDKLGNVSFALWKSGFGFRDDVIVNQANVRKLRDWLSKVIEYTER